MKFLNFFAFGYPQLPEIVGLRMPLATSPSPLPKIQNLDLVPLAALLEYQTQK